MIAEPLSLTSVQRVGDIPSLWASALAREPVLVNARASHTWSELEAARLDWRRRLAEEFGVRPGDRVMVVGENGPAMALFLFAVPSTGAWVVNVNARLAAREIDTIREHCGARR